MMNIYALAFLLFIRLVTAYFRLPPTKRLSPSRSYIECARSRESCSMDRIVLDASSLVRSQALRAISAALKDAMTMLLSRHDPCCWTCCANGKFRYSGLGK